MFITFEGIEGSGKTTQHRMLVEYLRTKYPVVHSVKEPGSTEVGEKLRAILLHDTLTPLAEAFIVSASRNMLITNIIAPALEKDEVVVCDRYVDTTTVIQGDGLGVDKSILYTMASWATQNITPDFTIYLDVDPKKANERKKAQKEYNKLDDRGLALGNCYREGYQQLIAKNPERWIVVSAEINHTHSADSIHGMIVRRLNTMMHWQNIN